VKVTIESSKAFAKSAALPVVEDFGLESVDEFAIPDFSKPDLAVTVGSQIASFSAAVEPDLREKISNGFLFAQQAANKRLEDAPEASSFVWYSMYVHVLNQIGWTTEADGTLENEIKGTSAQVQNEIISIINAALGPAIASSSMLVKVLEGLSNMDKNSPWITLFNRESQRATLIKSMGCHVLHWSISNWLHKNPLRKFCSSNSIPTKQRFNTVSAKSL